MGKKVISYCLYGTAPKYFIGLVRNLESIPSFYPGWTVRIYVEEGLDVSMLTSFKPEIVIMPKFGGHYGMYWRLLPLKEQGLERIIFRDTDSRVGPREAVAVKEWIDSGLNAHCMHDHLHHGSYPVFGGMWGCKLGVIPPDLLDGEMKVQYTHYHTRPRGHGMDTLIISKYIHPLISNSLLRHSSINVKWPYRAFPIHKLWEGFVGQQHDEKGPVWP